MSLIRPKSKKTSRVKSSLNSKSKTSTIRLAATQKTPPMADAVAEEDPPAVGKMTNQRMDETPADPNLAEVAEVGRAHLRRVTIPDLTLAKAVHGAEVVVEAAMIPTIVAEDVTKSLPFPMTQVATTIAAKADEIVRNLTAPEEGEIATTATVETSSQPNSLHGTTHLARESTSTLATSLPETPTIRVRAASVDDVEAPEVKATETIKAIEAIDRNQAGDPKPQLRPAAGLVPGFSMTI